MLVCIACMCVLECGWVYSALLYVWHAVCIHVSTVPCGLSAAHGNYLMLLRKHVSRNAPGKGRALLEALRLTAPQIEGYYGNHPLNEVEAVQAGLQGWVGERDPTWGDLLKAMKDAEFNVQYCNELKIALSTNK